MIKMFAAKGAGVHRVTSYGESYLHFAVFMNRKDGSIYVNQGVSQGTQRLHPGRRATLPGVTIDGKYLFFVSDFYPEWVDARVLDRFRPRSESQATRGPEARTSVPGIHTRSRRPM